MTGKVVGTLTLWYQPEDTEAYMFAQSIGVEVQKAGWTVPPMPIPVPRDANMRTFMPPELYGSGPMPLDQIMPSVMRVGGANSELLLLSFSDPKKDPYTGLLYEALKPFTPSIAWKTAPLLPEGTLVLVVGAKL